jgi:phospholipase/carboxylesterase
MNDLVLQQPQPIDGQAAQLLLLFHGVGADAQDLHGLGQAIADRHPQAWVVSVQAPQSCDLGRGWQWFSVQGVSEHNRADRVAEALPGFVQAVAQWQRHSGIGPAQTTLLGFSQGAIMALAATQQMPPVAARVVAMAGRLAATPQATPVRIHLLHGRADNIVPAQASVDAHAALTALGVNASLDLFPGLGHGIDGPMLARLNAHLATP